MFFKNPSVSYKKRNIFKIYCLFIQFLCIIVIAKGRKASALNCFCGDNKIFRKKEKNEKNLSYPFSGGNDSTFGGMLRAAAV